jgi:NDP-sugar pyrophosphorylase family protein
MNLSYYREKEPFDTAGTVRGALHLRYSEPVLIINGDSFCESDMNAFLTGHGAIGTEVPVLPAQMSSGLTANSTRSMPAGVFKMALKSQRRALQHTDPFDAAKCL